MKMLTPNQVLFENVCSSIRASINAIADRMDNKTVPCKPEMMGQLYEISFNMTANEDATEFLKKCDEIYAETAAADTKRKWKPKPMYYPYKELDDGTPQGKAKLKGAYSGEAKATTAKRREPRHATRRFPPNNRQQGHCVGAAIRV